MVPCSIALGPQLPQCCAQLDSLRLCSLLGNPGSLQCHDVKALNSCTGQQRLATSWAVALLQQAHACQAPDPRIWIDNKILHRAWWLHTLHAADLTVSGIA